MSSPGSSSVQDRGKLHTVFSRPGNSWSEAWVWERCGKSWTVRTDEYSRRPPPRISVMLFASLQVPLDAPVGRDIMINNLPASELAAGHKSSRIWSRLRAAESRSRWRHFSLGSRCAGQNPSRATRASTFSQTLAGAAGPWIRGQLFDVAWCACLLPYAGTNLCHYLT